MRWRTEGGGGGGRGKVLLRCSGRVIGLSDGMTCNNRVETLWEGGQRSKGDIGVMQLQSMGVVGLTLSGNIILVRHFDFCAGEILDAHWKGVRDWEREGVREG